MVKKKIIILSLALILSALGMSLFSYYQSYKVGKEIEKQITPLIKEKKEAVKPQKKYPLLPSRPEDYGMVVVDDFNRPKTQEEVDALLKNKIKEMKSQAPPEAWANVQEAVKESPDKTAGNIKKIDESIQKCKDILRQDPGNKEAQDRLYKLMTLKGIAKELPGQ